MTDLDFLARVELLEGLQKHELEEVQRRCQADKRAAGELIFAEDDEAADIFCLVEGRVDLRYELPGRATSQETTISTILPGGIFGWSALVPPHRYTLSAYAVGGDCFFLRLNKETLTSLFEQQPRIGYVFMRNLARVIGQRFHALEETLVRLEGLELMQEA